MFLVGGVLGANWSAVLSRQPRTCMYGQVSWQIDQAIAFRGRRSLVSFSRERYFLFFLPPADSPFKRDGPGNPNFDGS